MWRFELLWMLALGSAPLYDDLSCRADTGRELTARNQPRRHQDTKDARRRLVGHNKLNAHFEMQIRHQDTEGRQVELLADAGRGTLTIAVYTSSFTGNLLISRLMLTRPDHEQLRAWLETLDTGNREKG
jgi:hypothetical protein